MSTPKTLYETDLKSLKLSYRGKVRDIYDINEKTMLIVTTDRISAFDVILRDPVAGKGRVLTSVSNFWFDKMRAIVPNHLSGQHLETILADLSERQLVEGRAVVVQKLDPLPVEAIVRGYLIGSGWKDYQKNKSICGVQLDAGLRQAEQLPHPIFTPSTKAKIGDHDENISFQSTVDLIGRELAEQIRRISLRIYAEAAEYSKSRGIIIADTKFEFGLDVDGRLHLIDELLTPDSSRFWPIDQYQLGSSPPSFDKQFVRDYLETLDWNKTPPAPKLPKSILLKTAEKYQEAESRLTANGDRRFVD